MNIGNSVYWYVHIIVGAKVGRDNNGGVDIDINEKFGSGDGEGSE